MQTTRKNLTETQVELTVAADAQNLSSAKEQAVRRLAATVNVPGFREGKAPLNVVEKYLPAARLQAEFLDIAINRLYIDAATDQKLRPISQPEIKITKFVPFDALELTAKIEVIGEITLPDYKKVNVTKQNVKVDAKEVDEAIRTLLYREAEKKEVTRAARNEDEVLIDFNGEDAKTHEPIKGASGKDYPLWLGSNTFIPGFEEYLIGLKPGDDKTFEIVFPKDYELKTLQNRKVIFKVTVKKVMDVVMPKLDDKFAVEVSQLKTISELKADIKKRLESERQRRVDSQYENDLLGKIAEATKVALPTALIDEQLKAIEEEERQNQTYRGQTWPEYLRGEGITEEEYRDRERPEATLRVKTGLALAEIAEKEGVNVTREELEERLRLLKQQYPNSRMQAELDKPESRQGVFNRLVAEKTMNLLVGYNQKRSVE
jgi:trigger factor